ncbi:MAG TPA: polysaccharide deacetylase family protein [Pseudobacteroides sp.]|nr:polysaccharide deacetylase family protein [Pseudobacteroides sp.]
MIYRFTAEEFRGRLSRRYYCNLEVYRKRRKIRLKTIIMFSSLIANVFLIILRLYDIGVFNVNELNKSNAANSGFAKLYHSSNVKISLIQKCYNSLKKNMVEDVKSTVLENENSAEDKNTTEDKNSTEDKNDVKKDEKVAYLTFDDGPTAKITPEVLRILKEFDIKATFFVLGEMCRLNPEILKETQAMGHLICNHTYSHDYDKIYSSKEAFINDLQKCEETIVSILGTQWNSNKIIRFPGGSFGKKLIPFKEEIKKRGYISYDWNALNGDAEGIKVPAEKLIDNVVKSIEGKDNIIVLMHDSGGKETTVESLPDVITLLKNKGYVFKTLDQYE